MSFCTITGTFRNPDKTVCPNLPVVFDPVSSDYDDNGQVLDNKVVTQTDTSGDLSESLWVGASGSSYHVTVKGSPTYQINIPPNILAASLAYLRNRSAPAGTLSEWQSAVPDPVFRAALESIGITSLADLQAATSIDLHSVDLAGVNWEGLRYAGSATVVNLDSCRMVGTLAEFSGLAALTVFIIENNNSVSGDLHELNQLVNLVFCDVRHYYVSADIGVTSPTFTTQAALYTLYLDSLGLSQAEVGTILANCVTSLSLPGRVACTLHLQNNTAPDSQGLADVDTLVSAGWTVTHDA